MKFRIFSIGTTCTDKHVENLKCENDFWKIILGISEALDHFRFFSLEWQEFAWQSQTLFELETALECPLSTEKFHLVKILNFSEFKIFSSKRIFFLAVTGQTEISHQDHKKLIKFLYFYECKILNFQIVGRLLSERKCAASLSGS